jgi:hypothetical protein
MKPYEAVSYKGKSVVVVDIANTKPAETISALNVAQKQISLHPTNSVLILTDVTGTTYNNEVSVAIKDFTAKNSAYVKKSAVVGVDGLRMVLLRTVMLLTRRDIKPCATRQEALDWLVN